MSVPKDATEEHSLQFPQQSPPKCKMLNCRNPPKSKRLLHHPSTECEYDSDATIPIDRPGLWVSNLESNVAVTSEHDPDHYPSNTPVVPTSWIDTPISIPPPSKPHPNVTSSKVTNLDESPLKLTSSSAQT